MGGEDTEGEPVAQGLALGEALVEAEREGSEESVGAAVVEGVAEGESVRVTVAVKVTDTVLVVVGGGVPVAQPVAVAAPEPVPPPSVALEEGLCVPVTVGLPEPGAEALGDTVKELVTVAELEAVAVTHTVAVPGQRVALAVMQAVPGAVRDTVLEGQGEAEGGAVGVPLPLGEALGAPCVALTRGEPESVVLPSTEGLAEMLRVPVPLSAGEELTEAEGRALRVREGDTAGEGESRREPVGSGEALGQAVAAAEAEGEPVPVSGPVPEGEPDRVASEVREAGRAEGDTGGDSVVVRDTAGLAVEVVVTEGLRLASGLRDGAPETVGDLVTPALLLGTLLGVVTEEEVGERRAEEEAEGEAVEELEARAVRDTRGVPEVAPLAEGEEEGVGGTEKVAETLAELDTVPETRGLAELLLELELEEDTEKECTIVGVAELEGEADALCGAVPVAGFVAVSWDVGLSLGRAVCV